MLARKVPPYNVFAFGVDAGEIALALPLDLAVHGDSERDEIDNERGQKLIGGEASSQQGLSVIHLARRLLKPRYA